MESSLILLLRGRAFESRLGLEKAVVEPVCREKQGTSHALHSHTPVCLVMGEAPARSQGNSRCSSSLTALADGWGSVLLPPLDALVCESYFAVGELPYSCQVRMAECLDTVPHFVLHLVWWLYQLMWMLRS